MSISERRRLRISIVMLTLLAAGTAGTDRARAQTTDCNVLAPSDCVEIMLIANVQLAKLHPAVTDIQVRCSAPFSQPATGDVLGRSAKLPVVNRGYAANVNVRMRVARVILADPAQRTLNVTCNLELLVPGSGGGSVPIVRAEAAPAESITQANYTAVAFGSVVTWTQAVTVPNIAP